MEYSMPLGNLLDVINDFIEANDEFSYEEIIELLNNHTIELNCVEDDDDFLCSLLEEISEDSEEDESEDDDDDEEDEEEEDDEDEDEDDDKF